MCAAMSRDSPAGTASRAFDLALLVLLRLDFIDRLPLALCNQSVACATSATLANYLARFHSSADIRVGPG